MEDMSGSWPWLVLIAGLAGFGIGYYFGKPRLLASWTGPAVCGAACNCSGPPCTQPVGPGFPHVHCSRQPTEVRCTGTCTVAGAHTVHVCSHSHTF